MKFKTQIQSDVATGTAPIAVASTTLVSNLNVEQLDSHPGSYYLPAQTFTSINRYGFVNNSETTISFDGTNTFSLTRTGASFQYFRAGLLYTISANKTVVLSATPPAATGTYFIYIDGTDGDLIAGTGWTLDDTKVPVAIVVWNNSMTPKYFLLDERHTCLIDRQTHRYNHLTNGTQLVSTGLLTGGTLDTTTDASKVIGIPETKIADEDLFKTLAVLATPNGSTAVYYNLYRTASTTWVWNSSIMPFKYTTTGFIEYDNNGTMTPIANIRFANTYIFASNIEGNGRFIILSGRSEFANEAAALAESFASFDMSGFPIPEGVAIYKLTWQGSTNGGTGQCKLTSINRVTNNVTTSAVSQAVDHNGLANLQGGGSGEYYHLTSAQATAVANDIPIPSLTGNGSKVLAVNSGATAIEWIAAGGGTTTNALTINNSGTGAASGTTFNGSTAVTISYNTVGAAASGHVHSTYDNSTALTGANVYSNISITDGIVTGLTSRALAATDVGAAATSHAHGNITSGGAIGSTADQVVTTTTSGVLTTLSRSGIDSRTTFPAATHTHDYLPLSGGTLTALTQINNQAVLNTTTPGTANYGLHFTGQTTADYATGITWNGGTGTTAAQAGIYVQGSGAYGTKMYLATTNSYATGAQTAISIDQSGLTNFVRTRPTALGNTILDAGNFNSYSPTVTVSASQPGTAKTGDIWFIP